MAEPSDLVITLASPFAAATIVTQTLGDPIERPRVRGALNHAQSGSFWCDRSSIAFSSFDRSAVQFQLFTAMCVAKLVGGPRTMLRLAIVRIVDFSTRHPWWIIVIALTLSSASAVYVERHFAIKTDINELISPDLPWARRVAQFVKEFPQREILIVIDAPTPEIVEQAATKLAAGT